MSRGAIRDGGLFRVRRCRVGHRQVGGRGGRAFTLIELVLCIGIIMVLLGLVLPAMAAARRRGTDTRMLGVMRSNGALLALYAQDHDMAFPLSGPTVGGAMLEWYRPLIEVGLIQSASDVDPDGIRNDHVQRVAMSAAAACLPERMEPGNTLPMDMATSSVIRHTQVVHPSSKGILVQWVHVVPGEHRMWTYKAVNGPVSPIAFADNSVSSARSADFVLDHDFFENWVGHPVLATWSGVRGIDRRR